MARKCDKPEFVKHEPDYFPEPSLEQTFPEVKETEEDARSSRVVVVSPYAQINVFMEYKIPKLIHGAEADVINRTERDERPYFDVKKYENHAQRPLYVFDFGKLISRQPLPDDLSGHSVNKIRELINELVYAEVKKEHIRLRDGPARKSTCMQLRLALAERIKSAIEKIPASVMRQALNLAYAQIEKKIERLVQFKGYREWTKEKRVPCFVPTALFAERLANEEQYDEQGTFLPCSVEAHDSEIGHDLQEIFSERKGLQLFHDINQNAKQNSLDWLL